MNSAGLLRAWATEGRQGRRGGRPGDLAWQFRSGGLESGERDTCRKRLSIRTNCGVLRHQLERFASELESQMLMLRGQLNALGQSWRDQENEKFMQEFDETLAATNRFHGSHPATRPVSAAKSRAGGRVSAAAIGTRHPRGRSAGNTLVRHGSDRETSKMSGGGTCRFVRSRARFPRAVATFADEARNALATYDMELGRTLEWLLSHQPQAWQQEIRKAEEAIRVAKIELGRCRSQKLPGGGEPSCMEEKKILERAKRRQQFAEEKLIVTRKWGQNFQSRRDCNTPARPVSWAICSTPTPPRLALLDRVLLSLEAYVGLDSGRSRSTIAKFRSWCRRQQPAGRDAVPTRGRAGRGRSKICRAAPGRKRQQDATDQQNHLKSRKLP